MLTEPDVLLLDEVADGLDRAGAERLFTELGQLRKRSVTLVYVASVTASQGNDLTFTVFAVAVIGGIDLNGGRGRIVGATTGVLLLGLVQNLLLLSTKVPSFRVNAVYGGIILAALVLGAVSERGRLWRLMRQRSAS
jgi:ribose/xylose/arabinose/galactoside ABC-type transport system permease subunit